MIKNILLGGLIASMLASAALADTTVTSGSNAAAHTSTLTNQSQSQQTSSGASAQQGNSQAVNNISNTPADQAIRTAPSVAAPALTTTLTETCMGSASGGVSTMGFGLTLGKTYIDNACVRRLNAREIAQTLGDKDVAKEIMCADATINAAYASVGRPCRASAR